MCSVSGLEKMSYVILFCLWCLFGVFGCEFVSVTEGDSVILSMNLTEHQGRKGIKWMFGPKAYLIAEITIEDGKVEIYEGRDDGRFRDRLKLDHTGSLTITNTRITDSGLYEVTNTSTNTKLNTFNITVHARLPVPVITNSSSSSASNCCVLCSVMNVSHVSVSWYKGKSLLSSISVSEHRDISSISLHLECLDDSYSYSCVVNNSITNQTQHLNTDVCHKCSKSSTNSISDYIVPLSCAAGSLMFVTAFLMFCICRKSRKTHEEDQAGEEEITYADPTFYKRQTHKPRAAVEDDVVYAGVVRR
ncbi:hepatic and glial cell adhesion molecule-like isoform X2 [Triplophysa rosa]|uniref:hepatic and glial cell adhesion molecule-like isoform X2 n=1 Tax=Triplophysa rosa TaxID=992332 RepID=UPI002545E3DE|nr:hepatic and glial cell adhesion molecule-like isoform X2 [Triplophysa rosa]